MHHAQAWEPWLRLLGQLHPHRSWPTFRLALGQGLEALSGARQIAVFVGQSNPQAISLLGEPPTAPIELPRHLTELAIAGDLLTTKLSDRRSGIWLTLVGAGRVDLADYLPTIGPTLGLLIDRVLSFSPTRQLAPRLHDAAVTGRVGRSAKATLTETLAAFDGMLVDLLPIVVLEDDDGRLQACSRKGDTANCVAIDDPALMAGFRDALQSGRPLIFQGLSARSMALALRRTDAPTDFYYFLPVESLGEIRCLLGVGLLPGSATPAAHVAAAATDLPGFRRVSPRTLKRLGAIEQLRAMANEFRAAITITLAREASFTAGMHHERHYLGLDIHDSILQELSYTHLQLGRLQQEADPQISRAILREVQGSLEDVVRELRDLAVAYTADSSRDDIADAIAALVNRMRSRFAGDLKLDVHGTTRRLPAIASAHMAHIAQELLNNSTKHAEATQIRVGLRFTADRLELTVEDDGQGFEPSTPTPGHLGLAGMRRRVDEMGGVLDLTSQPGSGTVVRVEIPTDGA